MFKNMLKKSKKIVIIFTSVLFILSIVILVYFKFYKDNNKFGIKHIDVNVYSNYPIDEIKAETKNSDGIQNDYMVMINEQNIEENMGPFYKFWIQITPLSNPDSYREGRTRFLVSDFGDYADHWIFVQNPFGGDTESCALGFYQGDLSDEEVKKALYSVDLVYVYQNKKGINCDYHINISDDTVINFEEYPFDNS